MPVEKSVAKVTEITANSPESMEDAIRVGIERASKTLSNIRSAWVAEQHVVIENNTIAGYRVNLRVTFVLTD